MGNVQFRLSLTPYLYFSSLRLSAAAAEEVLGFILGPFSNSSLPSIPIRTHTHVPCAPIHIRLQWIDGFRGAQMKFTAISSACSIDSGWRQPGMMTGSRGENPCLCINLHIITYIHNGVMDVVSAKTHAQTSRLEMDVQM